MNDRVPYDPPIQAGEVEANHRHVSLEEADAANNPDVGAGTPASAPLVEPADWTLGERVRALLARPFAR